MVTASTHSQLAWPTSWPTSRYVPVLLEQLATRTWLPADDPRQIMLAFELICTACLFTVKVSILLFYRRTFPVPSFQLAVKIVMAFEIVIPIVLCIVYLLQCRPLDYMWNRSLEGSCFNVKLYLQSTVIINVVSDFVVLFMPLPIIWGLRMSVGRKIAVSAMFALGTL